jgi:hypothetical protein
VAKYFSANEWVRIAADHPVSRDNIVRPGSALADANTRIGLRIMGLGARLVPLDVGGLLRQVFLGAGRVAGHRGGEHNRSRDRPCSNEHLHITPPYHR